MRYILILLSVFYFIHIRQLPDIEEHTITKSYDPGQLDIIKLGPPNYQLYEYMKVYSGEYNIPFNFVLRCALEETGYSGKLDFRYRPFEDRLRVSYANAFGPLQVQLPTANEMWEDREITIDELSYNIKVNVISSFRYKKYLYDMFKDWLKVYSVYNMGWKGKSNINQYAKNIVRGTKNASDGNEIL